MKQSLVLFLSGWLIISCGTSQPPKSSASEASESATDPPPAPIDLLEDSRRTGPGFRTHVKSPEWEVRRRAAEAIGRIGHRELAPLLLELLTDKESAVRDSAVFAAGLLGPQCPPELKQALVDQLQTETQPESLATILDALGKMGDGNLRDAFIKFAKQPNNTIREASLKALGGLGITGVQLDPTSLKNIARYLSDSKPEVRLMAAFALTRLQAKKTPENQFVAEALKKAALSDPRGDVRAYALRAHARYGKVTETIVTQSLASDDHNVSATGVAIIDFAPEPDRCPLANSAIKSVASRLSDQPDLLQTGYLHTVRAALERGFPCTMAGAQKPLAEIARIAKQDPNGSAGSAGILCQTHLLLGSGDVILAGCDPARPHVGKRLLIQRLSLGGEKHQDRLPLLQGFTEDPDARVATKAIEALASIGGDVPSKIVIKSLDHQNPLCVAAALDGIASHPDHFRDNPQRTLASIDAVIDRFSPFDHALGPLISALTALKALALEEMEPLLRKLAVDHRPAIRYAVLDAYKAAPKLSPPAGLPALKPTNPVTVNQLETWRKMRATAHVSTTSGSFSFSLRSRVAPGTVGRFAELAKTGYYDNTEIHRVVPNFVVQAGDPSGTGLGDPGYAIRCEQSPIPYERGTVGMALSGKDTGGSQFFVTLSRQPHLDGNYTVFGKIVSGMEVVDLLEVGDRILGITIEQ